MKEMKLWKASGRCKAGGREEESSIESCVDVQFVIHVTIRSSSGLF